MEFSGSVPGELGDNYLEVIPFTGEYLDALRIVRVLFDDPVEAVYEPVTFDWSPTVMVALGVVVIEALKRGAADLGKTESGTEDYVGTVLDQMITEAMGRQAELGGSGPVS